MDAPQPIPNPPPMIQIPPININVDQEIGPDGRPLVILAVGTVYGQSVYRLDPATARKLGVILQENGSAAASNLILPKGA